MLLDFYLSSVEGFCCWLVLLLRNTSVKVQQAEKENGLNTRKTVLAKNNNNTFFLNLLKKNLFFFSLCEDSIRQ